MRSPSVSLQDRPVVDSKKSRRSGSTHRLFKSPTGDVVRVKTGFSWRAFFVGSTSALVKRVWLLLVVLAAGYGIAGFVASRVAPESSRNIALGLAVLGLYALYMLFCGINGNRWLVESLRRRGYIMIGPEKS